MNSSLDKQLSVLPTRYSWLISTLILLALAFLLFGNTFTHGWTMDDFPVVVNNPDIESFQAFWQDRQPGRPLRELSLLFDHFLFGQNPLGYHIQNIFWHGLNAVLVLLLCHSLRFSRWSAWAVALLFLVHPIQVEVVANISHRKDSLMLAFALMAFLAYIQVFARQKINKGWLFAALGFGFLSFMAKQTAVALPVIFWAYEICMVPAKERLLAKRPWVAWCAVLVVVGGVFWWVISLGGLPAVRRPMQTTLAFHCNYFGEEVFTAWGMMVLQSWSITFSKLLWPFGLAVEYVVPLSGTWLNPKVLGGVLLCLVWGGLTFLAYRRHHPRMFLGLVWMLGFFLPVSNLLPLAYPVADRYMYVPSLGFFFLIVLLIDRYVSNDWIKKTGVVLVIVLLSMLTFRQNRVWESSLSLYQHAVSVNPDSVFALNNLGWEFYKTGATEQALDTLQQAISVNPHYPRAWYNLGLLYERLGDGSRASVCYQNAVNKSKNLPGFEEQAEELRRHLLTRYGISSQ